MCLRSRNVVQDREERERDQRKWERERERDVFVCVAQNRENFLKILFHVFNIDHVQQELLNQYWYNEKSI